MKSLLPSSALTVEEKEWNAYPYSKTIFTCPFVDKFSLEIETYYTPDGGETENIFNLTVSSHFSFSYTNTILYFVQKSELRGRVVDTIDIVADQHKNYVKEEDLTVFISKKTGRGPLNNDWVQEYRDTCFVRQKLGD